MNLSRQIEAQRHSVERSIATSSASSPASTSAHFMSWPLPPGVDFPAPADPLLSGLKRTTSQVLDYQTVLGIHNSIGQNEAWCSSNYLAKRLRLESASNLPIYPHRPGEKDCAHYMLTRTCKFGEACKFDHPPWVPEGGIPDWKEEISLELRVDPFWSTTDFSERHLATQLNRWTSVSLSTTSEPLPERLGEPDCPYFLKTQRCKYGSKCKFNHPKDNLGLGASENTDVSLLPDRPSEPSCAFYMKTGKCKFGTTCKFHHPKDIWIPLVGQENGKGGEIESAVMMDETTGERPVLLQNSKGLPIRPGEVDCPFYMKTGSCKYGASCRYNHPDRNAINPPAAAIGHPILAPTVAHVNLGVVGSAVSLYQNIDPGLTQPLLGVGTTIYPQRPGQTACDYYMKTGECKFGERCKFHHPIDRSASTAMQAQQTLKLTLAGLPRREGVVHCPYYMKTGTCKYGATCKFDHPPPGEVLATTGSQRASASVGVEIDGA